MTLILATQNTLMMALWTSVATTIIVVGLAIAEGKSGLDPVVAISHIAFGDASYKPNQTGAVKVGMGIFLNIVAMVGWCAAAEVGYFWLGLSAGNPAGAILVSSVVTGLAFITDFHIVPKRFTPGFERVLTRPSLYLCYVMLSVALLLGGMQRKM